MRVATVEEVKAALNTNRQELTGATSEFHSTLMETGKKIEKTTADITQQLDEKLKELERKQKNFFAFSGAKHFFFWAQPALTLIETALLIWFLFFK